MVKWIKENITLNNLAWVLVLLSAAKLINNSAEFMNVTANKVVTPLGKIFSEYELRRAVFKDVWQTISMPPINKPKVEEEQKSNVEDEVKSESFWGGLKKKAGWM